MKEATSELSSTLVVVVMVGALAAFFFTSVWPAISGSLKTSANCSKAVCYKNTLDINGNVKCRMPGSSEEITCPYKG